MATHHFRAALFYGRVGSLMRFGGRPSSTAPVILPDGTDATVVQNGSTQVGYLLVNAQGTIDAWETEDVPTVGIVHEIGTVWVSSAESATAGAANAAAAQAAQVAAEDARDDAQTAEANAVAATAGKEDKQSTFRAVGSGDERSTLNTFLAASSPLGVKQVIGSLSVSDFITIPSNTNVDLSAATITQTGTSKVTLDLNGVSNVTITGGRLIGTGVHVAGSTLSIGVNVRGGSSGVTVSDVTATGHGGAGVKVDASTDVTVRGCRVVGTSPPASTGSAGSQYGILVDGASSRVRVINNNVSATSQGIITSIASTDVSIAGNTVTGITGQHGMYIQTGARISVIGNIVDDCELCGIKLQINDSSTADVLKVVIANNLVSNVGSHGILISNVAATFTYRFRDVSVIGNVVNTTTEDGINLHSVSVGSVLGNVVRNTTRHGVILAHCDDVDIARNTLHTLGQVGILLNSGTSTAMNRIRVLGNTLRNPGNLDVTNADYGIDIKLGTDIDVWDNKVHDATGVMRYGFFFEGGDQASCAVRGNNFTGATDYGARVTTATAVKEWTNNTCSGTLGTILNLTVTLVTKVGMVGVNTVYQSSAVPSTGTFARGDICWNSAPSAAGAPGWVCTTAGSPGTWKAMANLAA